MVLSKKYGDEKHLITPKQLFSEILTHYRQNVLETFWYIEHLFRTMESGSKPNLKSADVAANRVAMK